MNHDTSRRGRSTTRRRRHGAARRRPGLSDQAGRTQTRLTRHRPRAISQVHAAASMGNALIGLKGSSAPAAALSNRRSRIMPTRLAAYAGPIRSIRTRNIVGLVLARQAARARGTGGFDDDAEQGRSRSFFPPDGFFERNPLSGGRCGAPPRRTQARRLAHCAPPGGPSGTPWIPSRQRGIISWKGGDHEAIVVACHDRARPCGRCSDRYVPRFGPLRGHDEELQGRSDLMIRAEPSLSQYRRVERRAD